MAIPSITGGEAASNDLAYQRRSLQDVSRTFALTIPELPPALRDVVGNAYLLCRLADTIEDDAALEPATKRQFSESFISVVEGDTDPDVWSALVLPHLSTQTPPAERDLVAHCSTVLRITATFNDSQRSALARCVRIMARGMSDFQEAPGPQGLESIVTLDRYCYHVAGVVGEMLTALFCDYSPDIRRHKTTMMPLAVSFGQGLQMTNILKDVWADYERGVCWLPQDVFAHAGGPPGQTPAEADPGVYQAGVRQLVGVAHAHLRNALRYTLLIPRRELGVRRFCLWALGMAVLTLRKIHEHPPQAGTTVVKISRRAVKATVLTTSAAAGNDWALNRLFSLAANGLPLARLDGETSVDAVSQWRENELSEPDAGARS